LFLAVIKTKSSLTSNAAIMFSLPGNASPFPHGRGFGLKMMGQPTRPKEAGVFRGVAPAIGLFVGLLPAMALAQTNIDQGKSPAEIFANDCATCHKSARGLANGRGSSGLASFLVEHYTASKDQAAALAAYVMGAGGGDAVPARGPKPTTDRNRASTEQPKPSAQPGRTPGKPDQDANRPPGTIPTVMQEPDTPDRRPGAARPGSPAAAASRNRRNEPVSPSAAQQPAAVVAEPASSSPPAQDTGPVPGPSAAVPANTDSGESAPVPRDDIPD
jgi:mono/diheme cytochrome c family protein